MIRYGILMDRKMDSAEIISLLKWANTTLIAVLSLKALYWDSAVLPNRREDKNGLRDILKSDGPQKYTYIHVISNILITHFGSAGIIQSFHQNIALLDSD